jgi:hypothetical protein
MSTDPFDLFDAWYAEARESEPNDSNAMALATVNADLQPSVRMVLLKGHGPDGFVFYTNRESRKAQDLHEGAQGRAAVPLEVAAPPDPDRGRGQLCQRCRERCLFRQPRPRFAARCLGIGPVAPAR